MPGCGSRKPGNGGRNEEPGVLDRDPSSAPSPPFVPGSWSLALSSVFTFAHSSPPVLRDLFIREVILNKRKRVPTVLMVLDGWGVSTGEGTDAIAGARKPRMDDLMSRFPRTTIGASGRDVGLPEGQIGNSEVGHLNLGAGRVVYQDLTRINMAVESGSFFENQVFLEAFRAVKGGSGRLHVMGLMSDGGVHSHIEQIKALVTFAAGSGLGAVFVHAFMDGRDTPPNSGIRYIGEMEDHLSALGIAHLATVSGRFYAMDRDSRWERLERAYKCLVRGEGLRAATGREAVAAAYQRGETDEFIQPTVVAAGGSPAGKIGDGDGVIFMNFRGDRAREITRALNDADFDHFTRGTPPSLSTYVCLAEYDETFPYPVAFPTEELTGILGEVISSRSLTQLRIAETEKYAHVTFFFNGGEEKTFPGEDRCLIPSPKDVATYDLKPEMSAEEVTQELLRRLDSGTYDFILVNYANPDMVGHTGVYDAAVTAIEKVDDCVGRVADKVLEMGGALIVTSDHGNAESMIDPDGTPHTAHTTRRVPLVLVAPGCTAESPRLREGRLADVAPTILKIMGVPQPREMTGEPLF
ncbi:MAG: 2,3-bisphosphoglycerate-independent phosphoglycerate mutase [bacterium]|nr:MAG: 2,3-bisphosphoglycerate-independent phosphoglycerate mutase [bacterium]